MMFHFSSRLSSALAAATLLGAVLFTLPSAAMAQASPAPAAKAGAVEARI